MNIRILQIITITSVIVWVGVSLIGSYVVWDGFSSARISNKDLNLRIYTIQEKQEKASEAKASFALLEEDLVVLTNSLLIEDEVLNLLVEFEGFAYETSNDYTVNIVQDEYVSKVAKTKKRPAREEVLPGSVLSIELVGTFDGLYQFLDRVHELPYVMQVQRMNAKLGIGDDIQTSLRIKIFSPI